MKTAYRLALLCGFATTLMISAEPLKLNARRQAETTPGSRQWRKEERNLDWDSKKTALIICDMWNEHWCKGATERVGEMAPRMNEVVKAARAKGVFIIHAPSDTMKFYEGTVQRKRAQEAKKATPPVPLKRWCNLDLTKEAALPIDDSDGGCDDDPKCKSGPPYPWKRQIATIDVAEEDAVTDSDEAYNLLQERGIENVIVMGVHANMCVLGRPFSIRQMVGVGKNVVLMRDMTDTMYNSRQRPFVNHFRGTDLIVDHIERYWCPSITSVDFVGGEAFRFAKDPENPKNKQTFNYSEPSESNEQAGPLRPVESLKAFKVFDDLKIEEVLAEPVVRQPLHLSWDSRGRLWVVQYIQYPAPAGLTLISKDQFWRAVYDKVPPPPPKHFKGEDKITIHEDTDGDGVLDKHKTFVEGLNIVTAVEHGAGGVWVLNPPYLLFFPDKNSDDVVDADPVVHLVGFGLEDTHSVANSLRWGPDGWLYGAHGSTVTANIVRPGLDEKPIAHLMGQGVWRYHPGTRQFEVFAEGGGNAFGLEIDDKGRIFSGHNGGNTRGFHYVQGGYLQKGFEKHGPLSNPYAFGYFKQMAHPDVERFTHTFVIYGGGALPEKYNGQLLGIEPLQGRVVLSELQRDRSSFKTRDVGYAVTTSDKYFKPVDIKVGPDGAVYIADWYDRQVTHTRNYEGNIDKSNGRIYRLKSKTPPEWTRMKMSEDGSFSISHVNRWKQQDGLRRIAAAPPQFKKSAPDLKQMCVKSTGQAALDTLWAYNLCEPIADENAAEFLQHADPQVRLWTVRLLGDRKQISQGTAELLKQLAEKEADVEVRSQLASTAKRLPAGQALPIVRKLLTHHEDAEDIHLPLLLWWAIESKAESDRGMVMDFFKDASLWEMRMVRGTIGERIVKRYAMAGTQTDLKSCAALLNSAPEGEKKKLVRALEEGFRGRSLARIPAELEEAISKAGGESLAFAVRRRDKDALEKVKAFVNEAKNDTRRKVELIEVLGEVKTQRAGEFLVKLLSPEFQVEVQEAAAVSLQIYDDASFSYVPERLIAYIKNAKSPLRVYNVLASRTTWAEKLLEAVKRADIAASSVPLEIVEKMRADEKLAAQVDEVFGAKRELDKAAIETKLAKFASVVKGGSGDPFAGYANYNLACASCHTLFGEGGQIGPDLTSYRRDDLETMLMHIVNPNGEIREGFENVIIETKDGRNLSGFLAERYEDAVVLRGLDGESTLVKKNEIVKTRAAGGSLMPEGLLDGFEEQQIRDLFAYLRSTQPLVKKR